MRAARNGGRQWSSDWRSFGASMARRWAHECFEALEFLVEAALVAVIVVLLVGIARLAAFAILAEAFGGFLEVFNVIAEGT
jgi:hypothetical protein